MSNRAISDYLSQLGKKGAATTNAQLTPAQRKNKARKAAQARWSKHMKSLNSTLREAQKLGAETDAKLDRMEKTGRKFDSAMKKAKQKKAKPAS